MDLGTFLRTVITTEKGWLCLSFADADKSTWQEEWYRWPSECDSICNRVDELKDGHNVYYSPFLFREKKSVKANVLPTRTIVADLDEANILTIPIKCNVLVETSPERHQGYWFLSHQAETLEHHEELSKRLTYAIPRCDRTGWWLGKKVRVPETFNYKYVDGAKPVRVVDANTIRYNTDHFEALPVVSIADSVNEAEKLDDWIEVAEAQTNVGPYELLERFRGKLPPKVLAYYDRTAADRSEALWALTTSLFRAGATKEEVYVVAKASANNKFADLRHGGRRELGKDILRAKTNVETETPDIRSRIFAMRRLPGAVSEKKSWLAREVVKHLEQIGNFVHCTDGSHWYVREDTGRPVPIVQRGEQLQIMLDTLYGLNASETETSYTVHNLISHCSSVPPSGNVASLAYYDTDTKNLFLHTGRKDVLRVSSSGISHVTDGYQGIVFPWSSGYETINPRYVTMEQPWWEQLFGDCLDNLVGLQRNHAMALLRTWLIMLLLRNSVVSRPILAIFGQPGAGKSTLFRRVYTLLYGRGKSLGAVSTPEDFDFACATDPLVVLDNVDTWEKWLPDRLALAAAASDLQRRKLYTNAEVVTLKRQALLGITAHNPQFGREDVNDRLILLTFERLQHFKPETDILDRIHSMRPALWGAILQDVQHVLSTPQPLANEVPQFRVEDFARIGYWIASSVGVRSDFTDAITSLRDAQKSFTLEEDHVLIDALGRWIEQTRSDLSEFRTPGQLWPLLESKAIDSQMFKHKYRNAIVLGKKMWSLQDSLRSVYDVQWKYDPKQGSRAWQIMPKGQAKPRVIDMNKPA